LCCASNVPPRLPRRRFADKPLRAREAANNESAPRTRAPCAGPLPACGKRTVSEISCARSPPLYQALTKSRRPRPHSAQRPCKVGALSERAPPLLASRGCATHRRTRAVRSEGLRSRRSKPRPSDSPSRIMAAACPRSRGGCVSGAPRSTASSIRSAATSRTQKHVVIRLHRREKGRSVGCRWRRAKIDQIRAQQVARGASPSQLSHLDGATGSERGPRTQRGAAGIGRTSK
jgi:hypothetical protein